MRVLWDDQIKIISGLFQSKTNIGSKGLGSLCDHDALSHCHDYIPPLLIDFILVWIRVAESPSHCLCEYSVLRSSITKNLEKPKLT